MRGLTLRMTCLVVTIILGCILSGCQGSVDNSANNMVENSASTEDPSAAWTKEKDVYRPEDIDRKSYAVNLPDENDDGLYKYTCQPLALNLSSVMTGFFGDSKVDLTDNIPQGDQDITLKNNDKPLKLYRNIEKGYIEMLKGDADVERAIRVEWDANSGSAENALIEGARNYLTTLFGVDGELLHSINIEKTNNTYKVMFGYYFGGKRVLGDANVCDDAVIFMEIQGNIVTSLYGNLISVTAFSALSTEDQPMPKSELLDIITTGPHPPYGEPEVCYYLTRDSSGAFTTKPIWNVPLLNLQEGVAFNYSAFDGKTGKEIRL